MRHIYGLLIVLTLASVPTHGQNPQSEADALEETGEWLRDKLKDYGSFRIRVTVEGVLSWIRLAVGDAELRLEIDDVSFNECTLEYTYVIREGMMGYPSISKIVIPLASVDVSSIVEEPMELGPDIRMEGLRSQVHVVASRDAPSFVLEVDRQETPERSVAIFIDSSRHAREVVEKLQEAVRLCSGG